MASRNRSSAISTFFMAARVLVSALLRMTSELTPTVIPARMAMMEMTARISTRVKAFFRAFFMTAPFHDASKKTFTRIL